MRFGHNLNAQIASAWTLGVILTACVGRDTDLSTSPLISVAADLHMHHVCPAGRLSSEQLLAKMEREEIEVGAALVAAQSYAESVDRFDGRDDPASRPNRILHDDLEISGFPAAGFGHLVLLDLENIRFSEGDAFASPRTLRPVIEWAPARAVIGYAHGWAWPAEGYPRPGAYGVANCCIPFSFPVDITTGRIAFLAEELADHNARGVTTFDGGPLTMGTSILWRTAMNSGYRLALTGGSDIICLNDTVGSPRTLALIEGPLSYRATVDAVRRGRTAVASVKGHRLDLRVEGARLGDDVALATPSAVEVVAPRAPLAPVEILVNGVVVRTLREDEERATIPIAKSSWIAARTRRVQTSAITVTVAGRPIRASADDTCFLARYVDHLRALAAQAPRPETQLWLGPERERTLESYDAAKRELMARFREAGGERCD